MLLYVAYVLLLYHGPSGLVVRTSDWYSEGLGFESQKFFHGFNLSALLPHIKPTVN